MVSLKKKKDSKVKKEGRQNIHFISQNYDKEIFSTTGGGVIITQVGVFSCSYD